MGVLNARALKSQLIACDWLECRYVYVYNIYMLQMLQIKPQNKNPLLMLKLKLQ